MYNLPYMQFSSCFMYRLREITNVEKFHEKSFTHNVPIVVCAIHN